MNDIEQALNIWEGSLCPQIEWAGLVARNPVAHKWKATYRSNVLRELVSWRLHDLLSQTLALLKLDHVLGARILLRSSIETLAILIYLNQITDAVLNGGEDFFDFCEKTSRLMLGSKDESTKRASINVMSCSNDATENMVELLTFIQSFRRTLIQTTKESAQVTPRSTKRTTGRNSRIGGRRNTATPIPAQSNSVWQRSRRNTTMYGQTSSKSLKTGLSKTTRFWSLKNRPLNQSINRTVKKLRCLGSQFMSNVRCVTDA